MSNLRHKINFNAASGGIFKPTSRYYFGTIAGKCMIIKREKNRISILLVLTVLLVASPAYAYVDPNTTSLISQSLTPLFVIGARSEEHTSELQ